MIGYRSVHSAMVSSALVGLWRTRPRWQCRGKFLPLSWPSGGLVSKTLQIVVRFKAASFSLAGGDVGFVHAADTGVAASAGIVAMTAALITMLAFTNIVCIYMTLYRIVRLEFFGDSLIFLLPLHLMTQWPHSRRPLLEKILLGQFLQIYPIVRRFPISYSTNFPRSSFMNDLIARRRFLFRSVGSLL